MLENDAVKTIGTVAVAMTDKRLLVVDDRPEMGKMVRRVAANLCRFNTSPQFC